MKACAVIVAAGKGKRFSEDEDLYKQFQDLAGKPVVCWSIEMFEGLPSVNSIVLVAPEEKSVICRGFKRKYRKISAVVPGGRFRQDSVYNGLLKTPKDADFIFIHDSVRPLATSGIAGMCLEEAGKWGASIPAVPVKDTVKMGRKMMVEQTIDRSRLWAVQTPQCFRRAVIIRAHEKARKDGFVGSDDSSLVERLPHEVRIVSGSEENIKITFPDDLILAEGILKRRGIK
jgi:2-C-methyl-D-erythritol 4-phosphate cytidylyltransferase